MMLVFDECQYLLPYAERPTSAPDRLNYIIADLCNRGIAVALIGGMNFARSLANIEKRLVSYGSEQFWGRISLRKRLPDSLNQEDLFLLVRALLPEGSETMHMLIVGHTLNSKGKVGAMEHTVKRARFFAERESRPVEFDDIEAVIAEDEGDQIEPREAAAKPPRTGRVSSPPSSPPLARGRCVYVSP